MAELSVVYTTLPSKQIAKKISDQLLDKSLVACTNIFPSVSSSYIWKGKRVTETEVVMICKTTGSKAPALVKALERLHPYECPCIFVFKPKKVNKKYSRWVEGALNL